MSKQCENPAVFRYIWRGKDESFCCIEHINGINRIASAMGLPLHARQITSGFTSDDWPQCRSFAKSS